MLVDYKDFRFIINVQFSNVAHTYSSYIGSILFSSTNEGPEWLNELGSWFTQQLIQDYHQYGVGSRPVYKLQKRCTRLAVTSDIVYQLLAHGRWLSPGTPASSITKTGRHEIVEILVKVALNAKSPSIKNRYFSFMFWVCYIADIVLCKRTGFRPMHFVLESMDKDKDQKKNPTSIEN